MKLLTGILLLLLAFSAGLNGQPYQSQNISLVSVIAPNTSTVPSQMGNKYAGCWAWFQASKNKEYGICGASNGTYFIDISNPATPSVSAFVPGRNGSTWREIKTYRHYCYVACDDSKPNLFQIIDMQYLPDSVKVLHSGAGYIERGHTLWVDSNRLYVGAATFASDFSPMAIFSLSSPAAPVLLKRMEEDIDAKLVNYVHDMYARNDTIYASCGNSGLYILKYDPVADSLLILGSYKDYPGAGYNHSSFLTKNGKHLLFCDEIPMSLPVHMVDVQNPANVQPLQTFYPEPLATAHNPYIIGNQFAVVSCYQDGLYIYDISQPTNIKQTGYFDTYPQGGANTGTYSNAYAGNWGAYPYLPSGLIVANDMQNGMFVLNPAAAYTVSGQAVNALGLSEKKDYPPYVSAFPNPAQNHVTVFVSAQHTWHIQLHNSSGKMVYQKYFHNTQTVDINTGEFAPGLYFLTVNTTTGTTTKKLQLLDH